MKSEQSSIKELKNIIQNIVMPDLEEVIDEIYQTIASGEPISLGEREELEELQEIHNECREILIEIESGEMEEEEAKELLAELTDIVQKD